MLLLLLSSSVSENNFVDNEETTTTKLTLKRIKDKKDEELRRNKICGKENSEQNKLRKREDRRKNGS